VGYLDDILRDCEAEIRGGQINSVRKKLSGLNTAQVPRQLRLPFANLCRRTELLNLGLKLLASIVRPDKTKWRTDASPAELSEYAVLLQKSGAVREALWILSQVDVHSAPEALLFKAYCHFNKWEYAEAAEGLQQYTALEQRPYQRLVGSVNLAAAQVALSRWTEALQTLNDLIRAAMEGGYTRLQANCLEQRAQVRFHQGDLNAARADLSEAAALSGSHMGLDQLFVRKWSSIIAAVEEKSPQKILEFRAEAVARGQWESVREADRYALKTGFEKDRFHRLLFGTPFARYREQILQESGRTLEQRILLAGDADGKIFDLQSGKFITPGMRENPSEKTHQLIAILMMDFYKPFATGGLFSELFPGEHFDFNSSMHRVRQVIYRARQWIAENELPMAIEENEGKYALKLAPGAGILVPYDQSAVTTETLRLEQLQSHFGGKEFSRDEACNVLGFSPTSFKSLMGWALQNERIVRLNGGRATRYRFAA
jgi:hypothetical protein